MSPYSRLVNSGLALLQGGSKEWSLPAGPSRIFSLPSAAPLKPLCCLSCLPFRPRGPQMTRPRVPFPGTPPAFPWGQFLPVFRPGSDEPPLEQPLPGRALSQPRLVPGPSSGPSLAPWGLEVMPGSGTPSKWPGPGQGGTPRNPASPSMFGVGQGGSELSGEGPHL